MAPGALEEAAVVTNGVTKEVTKEVTNEPTNGVTNGETVVVTPEAKPESKPEFKPECEKCSAVAALVALVNGKTEAKDVEKLTNGIAKKPETKSDDTTKSDDSDDKSKDEKKDEKPEDQTMKCEIKHLDRKYDEKDELYFVERVAEVDKPKQKDWWQLFAFCLVRHYDSDGDLDYTRLHVNPQPLRQLLRDIIGNYPSDPIDVDDVQIEDPYHSLFHYRKEIESVGLERFAEEPESLAQLKLLVGWIKSHFELDIAAYDKCVSGETKAIAYDRLWTVFPPETIVHCELLNQHRAFRIHNTWYERCEPEHFALSVNYVDFDGDNLGTRRTQLCIPKYSGVLELSELTTMPLHLIDNADEIRQALIARGRAFEGFVGQHYMEYNANAVKKGEKGYIRFNVSGRVMIDCKTYHRLEPNDSFIVNVAVAKKKARQKVVASADVDFASEEQTFDKLSDEDAMMTNATVRGYSFTVKRFLEFMINDLKPITWNPSCFDSLVLDPAIKKTVRALVSTHSQKRESFDDIVKGKGQGLVCVLHGPPGVGKTLTAECVAEYVQRPLYMVSSGDLGIDSADLDHELTRIMDMTATWRAVLLIDEADVFLEQRALHDLHRNAMVSVFLRVLEYYSGILFLTTNRVNTFDDAFKSRIHIPIRYTDLSFESRKTIWRNFCALVPGGVDVDDKGFEILAEHDLNGRQIKNAIKAAESLAAYDKVKLDLEQLLQVTKIQAMFEKDLTNLSGIDYTAPGQSRKDADSRNMFL
ncbi:hypothetical protein B0T22DRAFT_496150 [Podospora appendiculata]|uniref:AAA+ ATPase domain-containing protein n=1 Tax=Podospora appendiculata TaxID=314037 RepID=A0AAE0XH09_9PEZI|nr:hypothetical protein B0T22DRAFT_496150 [Podospora appendiculata]